MAAPQLATNNIRIAPRAFERLKAFQALLIKRGADAIPKEVKTRDFVTLSETIEVAIDCACLAFEKKVSVGAKLVKKGKIK